MESPYDYSVAYRRPRGRLLRSPGKCKGARNLSNKRLLAKITAQEDSSHFPGCETEVGKAEVCTVIYLVAHVNLHENMRSEKAQDERTTAPQQKFVMGKQVF
ncbi:MAG: hypothetical protein M1837_006472 [Sclerophora amabilis]|nr:MAG: hypothetical protein M1837_006472 [Sclerophora amabilis]